METTIIMRYLLILLIATSFVACHKKEAQQSVATQRDSVLNEQRDLLKEYALCKCLYYANNKDSVVANDISISIYREISDYGDKSVYDLTDSASKKAANAILPTQIADYDGKKPILMRCLEFYKSKSLDSLVKSFDMTYKKNHDYSN